MNDISEPIQSEALINDAHKINQEILRLANALKVDLTNESFVNELIYQQHLPCDDHFHKCQTLRGLIILRGKVAIDLKSMGFQDPINPVHEAIYKYLL